MTAITTLPLKPLRTDSKFLRITTFLFADFISRISKSDLYQLVNITESTSLKDLNYHTEMLSKMKVASVYTFADNDVGYEFFFKRETLNMVRSGLIKISEKKLSICSCGSVEVAANTLPEIYLNNKRKTCIYLHGGNYKCKKCHQDLVEVKRKVLAMSFNKTKIKTQPNIFQTEVNNLIDRNLSHDLIISRVNPASRRSISIENNIFYIDTDFYWSLMLGYISKYEFNITLVASHASILNAIKVILITKICFPQMNLNLIIHPVIKIQDVNSKLSTIGIEEYYNICGNPAIARAFISLGMFQKRSRVNIGSNELHLIKQTDFSRLKIADNFIDSIRLLG